MYDAIKYIHHIINCIVDCYTAIIWGSLNNKHDRTVFKTRFHFFEPSIQIEDCSNLMWNIFYAHWEGTLLRAQILNQCSDMYVPNSTQRIIICTWFTTCNRQSALTRRCHSKYPLINDSGLASLFTSKQFSFRQVVNMVRLNNVNFVNKASKFVKEKKNVRWAKSTKLQLITKQQNKLQKRTHKHYWFLEYIDLQSFSSDFSKARIFKTKVENRTSRGMPGSVNCIIQWRKLHIYTLGRFQCSRLEHPTELPLHPIYAGYWLMFMIDMNIYAPQSRDYTIYIQQLYFLRFCI